jgi:hypothetical protein
MFLNGWPSASPMLMMWPSGRTTPKIRSSIEAP